MKDLKMQCNAGLNGIEKQLMEFWGDVTVGMSQSVTMNSPEKLNKCHDVSKMGNI